MTERPVTLSDLLDGERTPVRIVEGDRAWTATEIAALGVDMDSQALYLLLHSALTDRGYVIESAGEDSWSGILFRVSKGSPVKRIPDSRIVYIIDANETAYVPAEVLSMALEIQQRRANDLTSDDLAEVRRLPERQAATADDCPAFEERRDAQKLLEKILQAHGYLL